MYIYLYILIYMYIHQGLPTINRAIAIPQRTFGFIFDAQFTGQTGGRSNWSAITTAITISATTALLVNGGKVGLLGSSNSDVYVSQIFYSRNISDTYTVHYCLYKTLAIYQTVESDGPVMKYSNTCYWSKFIGYIYDYRNLFCPIIVKLLSA